MAHVCKNHPETITRKRCHHCRTFICPECTRSFLDRPFCSTRCLIRSLLLEATAFWTTPTGTKPKSKKGGSPAARATSWLFPLITLSLFLMIWLSLRDLAHEVARALGLQAGDAVFVGPRRSHVVVDDYVI